MSKIKRFGRFEIQRVLGRGGMGTVHLAEDPLIGRTVAIKEIRVDPVDDENERAELEARFRLEFRSAGKLSHPNIVTVYDVGQGAGSYFIAMEYVEGMSLAQHLSEEPRPPFEVVRDWATQIASGLDYAHRRGIVHRDVKPANVLLTSDGRPKITDFGLVKVLTSDLTMTGTVLGTPAFMSPEQIMGKRVDGRSDQFSFAIILYLMLTGSQPFYAEHPSSILYQIVHQEPPRPRQVNRGLPEAVDRVLLRALAKNPTDRYPSCSDLAAELAAVLPEEPKATLPSRDPGYGAGEDTTRRPSTPSSATPSSATPSSAEGPAGGATRASTLLAAPDELIRTAATPRPPRRSRRGAAVKWLAAAVFLASMVALGYWASLRQQATPEDRQIETGPPPQAEGTAPVAEHTPSIEPEPVSLRITSAPEGAAISVGGRGTGLLTPAEVELDPDSEHVLELTLNGYQPAGWSFRLEDLDQEQRACGCLHFPLASRVPPGMITVNAPYPVSLVVDGQPHGPFSRGEVPVTPGRHRVVLVAKDVFLRQTSEVEIASGERRSLRVPKAVTVLITANPANCEVSVDGIFVDVTPINDRRLVVGSHELSFYWPALDVRKPVRKTVSREGQRISETPN